MAEPKVIPEKCIGCCLCPMLDPEVFAMGEDNIAYVKEKKITEKTEEAKNSCPTQAIVIE